MPSNTDHIGQAGRPKADRFWLSPWYTSPNFFLLYPAGYSAHHNQSARLKVWSQCQSAQKEPITPKQQG